MFRKSVFLSIVLTLILGLSACRPATVSFPDPSLEVAIREFIDKPEGPILPSDLEGLTSFDATFDASIKEITDLSGLEHCTNLTELYLGFNQISDISPLTTLTNLRMLDLVGNQISDISPLVENSGLSSGDFIYLTDNPLSTRSLSAYIPQLEESGVDVSW